MKTESLLGATAVGAIIMIVFSVLDTIIALSSPSLTGVGTSLACFVSVGVGILVGVIYGLLHSREATISIGIGVKGGAASGALTFFIDGIFTVIMGMILAPQMAESAVIVGATERATSVDAGMFSSILPLALLSVACGGIILGAIFGALGGAFGGAVFRQKRVETTV